MLHVVVAQTRTQEGSILVNLVIIIFSSNEHFIAVFQRNLITKVTELKSDVGELLSGRACKPATNQRDKLPCKLPLQCDKELYTLEAWLEPLKNRETLVSEYFV